MAHLAATEVFGTLNVSGQATFEREVIIESPVEISGSVSIIGTDVASTFDELYIEGPSPQIHFHDTDGEDAFWIHINSNNFYVLADRNGDGVWESPHPLRLEADTNLGFLFDNAIITAANIDGTPVDGATTEVISSNWAYDHNAGVGNSKHVPEAGSAGQYLAYNGNWATPPNTIPADVTINLTAGTNLSGGGSFTTNQSSTGTITFNVSATPTFTNLTVNGDFFRSRRNIASNYHHVQKTESDVFAFLVNIVPTVNDHVAVTGMVKKSIMTPAIINRIMRSSTTEVVLYGSYTNGTIGTVNITSTGSNSIDLSMSW